MGEQNGAWFALLSLLPAIGGLLGILWCFISPPPFSIEVSGPPAHNRNDPSRSVYLGNGCFWHTQYDFVVLEQEINGSFGGRLDRNVTSLVGYGGGLFQSPSGTACYHGLPDKDYSRLGHSEAVSISLDEITGPTARKQVAALAALYFEHGFNSEDSKRRRQDPGDVGSEYRNVIGLPGGMSNAELWPLFQAANVYGMPLIRGTGGTNGDTEDEYVVYVYDSMAFPFFRGEAYHQFHTNDVLGRPVPKSYTSDLKMAQTKIGRMDSTGCVELPGEVGLLIVFAFALIFGLGLVSLQGFMPSLIRICERRCCNRPRVMHDGQARECHQVGCSTDEMQ